MLNYKYSPGMCWSLRTFLGELIYFMERELKVKKALCVPFYLWDEKATRIRKHVHLKNVNNSKFLASNGINLILNKYNVVILACIAL